MIIQHLSYPFHHTIIYDYFSKIEFEEIYDECEYISSNVPVKDFDAIGDIHHSELVKFDKTKPYFLDEMYCDNRNKSNILIHTRKLFHLDLTDNPFSEYIKTSTHDRTTLNVYKKGSSYHKHKDTCILTVIHTIWKEPKTWTGGDLFFSDCGYKPFLKSNCCFIFPSFNRHEVQALQGDGVRYTVVQEINIK